MGTLAARTWYDGSLRPRPACGDAISSVSLPKPADSMADRSLTVLLGASQLGSSKTEKLPSELLSSLLWAAFA